VQVGSRINPGAPLLALVPLDRLWAEADSKESELRYILAGQPATVEAEMYGSKVSLQGKVRGLSAATDSTFSLLLAQDTSGTWIKLVQRVPVRIALDPKELAAHPLPVGLSATASIDITQKGGGAFGAVAAPAPQRYAATALNQPVERARTAIDAIVANKLAN
jgi:membrane fusion protein (multidrug efflux system)